MYGVPRRRLIEIGTRTPTDHELALQLRDVGSYGARTIATVVDNPQQVTCEQMQRWCDDFDSWPTVDPTFFRLFERTPHAWSMVDREPLFVRRVAGPIQRALTPKAP